jgi:CRP-like cAMP-binding protein
MFEVSLLKTKTDKLKEYKKAEIVFKEGSSGNRMFIIYSGKIRLYTEAPGKEVTLAIIGPGDFFGEMALIDSSPRTATAVAEETAKLLPLNQNEFMDMLKAHPDFSFIVIQNLCLRLRERWDLYRKMGPGEHKKKGQIELVLKSIHLDEINNALKFLQDQTKKERLDSEMKIVSNVSQFITPYLEKLAGSKLDGQQREWLSVVEANLNNIVSPFMGRMPYYSGMTPMELQIANLIKTGKTTKEISSLLNLSTTTIDFHRNNIRSKLGLINQKKSLRSHLMSISTEE